MTDQQGGPNEERQPYVGREDRPEPKLDPDQPISELRVRDLTSIVTQGVLKKWELKEPIKEKLEKFEHKELKLEKHEWKELKPEKYEKHEWKELKPEHKELKFEKFEKQEKIEVDPIKRVGDNIPIPDPETLPIGQLVETVGQLARRVDQLADQVAKLQEGRG
jgi:hypothetical protein